MYLPDSDATELRKWIIKKLEALEAVADADVLADFVIALLRTDTEELQLKQDAYGELEDFLKTHTHTFVDEVFIAVKSKSYLPGYVPHITSVPPSFAALPKPTRSGVPIDTNGITANGSQGSKKRSYNDMRGNEIGADAHITNGTRQTKQMRRGRGKGVTPKGRGGRSDYSDINVDDLHSGMVEMHYPGTDMPMYFPDQSQYPDPFAAMAALQAMGFPPLPQVTQTSPMIKKKGRCRDYDNKGFCARGNACPYQHGMDHVVIPHEDEYDPKNPTATSPTTHEHSKTNGSNRGRGDRGRRNTRADFSHAGPLHDKTATTIVVEQIPEENFNDVAVRNFFSEFGTVLEVTMQPYKRLALVKYDTHNSAQDAYNSPKVIFDNRFVKVYWYKPDKLPTLLPNSTNKHNATLPPSVDVPEESPFDRDEFERKSQEAQRRLEEKKAQMKDMADKRQVLEKQKQELAQKQAEEKKRLFERIAGKGASSPPSGDGGDEQMTDAKKNGTDEGVSASTKALRSKLAELEAEALSLGIDHSSPVNEGCSPRGRGRGRGRGSYRGWEGFAGTPSYGGSPRGRGGFRGWNGGGKYNLDLRTRKVEVSGVEWDNRTDEALRQYLLGVGEYDGIEPHSEKSDGVVVSFKDRQTAELFFYGTRELPGVGKLDFSWFNAPITTNGTGNASLAHEEGDRDGDADMKGMEGDLNGATEGGHVGTGAEVDYDVAEEDDRWN